MGNTMTISAFCKLFMNYSTVRLSMAILTGGQLAMGRMTLGAGQGRVLSLMRLQQLVSLLMTAGADLLALSDGIGDIKRGVHGMTGKTVRGFQHCHGTVVLMAFGTLGDATMFFRMAGRALLLRMLTDLCLQTGSNLGMAQLAAAFKLGRIRDRHQRLVRVGMAVQTLCHRFRSAVGCVMAAAALGHYVSIVAAERVISMKNFMALGAGNGLMQGAIITQPVVMRRVTAGAVLHGKGLHFNSTVNAARHGFCRNRLSEDEGNNNEQQYTHSRCKGTAFFSARHALPLLCFSTSMMRYFS